MSTVAETATETVHLKHQYPFTPPHVFEAWSNPEALGQWFGPHSHKCKVEKYDFRVDGEYQIRMIPVAEDTDCAGDSSKDSVCAGTFVEIIPDRKIAMTFGWIENGGDINGTLLTIEFNETSNGTEVTLLHERLPNKPAADAHRGGWEGTLEGLETYLAKL
ncbi:SRPBCC family protein [Kaarinaea lacus]